MSAAGRIATRSRPLAIAHQDLAALEREILQADRERFNQPESCAIKQVANQPCWPPDLLEHGSYLCPREYRRQAPRPGRSRHTSRYIHRLPEDLLVQEQQGARRLSLRGHADPPVGREVRPKRGNRLSAEFAGVTLAVMEDESSNPSAVRLRSPVAELPRSARERHGIEQARCELPETVSPHDPPLRSNDPSGESRLTHDDTAGEANPGGMGQTHLGPVSYSRRLKPEAIGCTGAGSRDWTHGAGMTPSRMCARRGRQIKNAVAQLGGW